MRLTKEQANKVAQIDYNHGIVWAVDYLASLGFDCNHYYKTMRDVEDVDLNDLNINTRDSLFEQLGISDLMNKAYSELGV